MSSLGSQHMVPSSTTLGKYQVELDRMYHAQLRHIKEGFDAEMQIIEVSFDKQKKIIRDSYQKQLTIMQSIQWFLGCEVLFGHIKSR